jgi:hypothetical protein
MQKHNDGTNMLSRNIVYNPARFSGSTRNPADLGLEPGRVEKKTRCDLAGWPGKTWSKTRLQLVDFYFLFFFTKTTSFWFLKKKN